MTKEELTRREKSLQAAGYRKSTATSSINDYSWFKTIRLNEERDSDYTYIIEWRVWNWRPYMWQFPHLKGDPFSLSLVVHISSRLNPRMDCSCPDSVEEGELIAQRFYEYSESVKKEIKSNKNKEQ